MRTIIFLHGRMSYYAVRHQTGETFVVRTWDDCKKLTRGKSRVVFKKFTSQKEADDWLNAQENPGKSPARTMQKKHRFPIYTDGSVMGGKAGCGVWFPETKQEFSARVDGDSISRAEAYAVFVALVNAPKDVDLEIFIDSDYCRNVCLQIWPANYHRDIFDQIWGILKSRQNAVRFTAVNAHSSNPDNDVADRLAKKGTTM